MLYGCPGRRRSKGLSGQRLFRKPVRGATDTPLRTARAAFEVLECLKVLVEMGNPNARSDAAVGAQLAYASLKGAQYNILTNIRALKDESFVDGCRTEISDLMAGARKPCADITIMGG